eukprot:gene6182-6019_t
MEQQRVLELLFALAARRTLERQFFGILVFVCTRTMIGAET